MRSTFSDSCQEALPAKHVLAVRGPHGRLEHLLADGTVKIILAEARRRRRGSLGHGNTSGPLREDRGRETSPALAS